MMYTGEKYPDNLINTSYLVAVATSGDHEELKKILSTNYRLDNMQINPLCFLLLVKEQSHEQIQKTVKLLIDYSNTQQNNFVTRNIIEEEMSLNIAERLLLNDKENLLPLIKPYVYLREDILQDLTISYIKRGKKELLKPIAKLINHYNYEFTNNSLVQLVLLIKGLNYNSDMVKNTFENRLMDVLDIYTQKNNNNFCVVQSKRINSGLNFMSMIASSCSSVKLLEYCINLIDFDVEQVKMEVTSTFRKNGHKSVDRDVFNYIYSLSQGSVEAVRENFLLNKKIATIENKDIKRFKL